MIIKAISLVMAAVIVGVYQLSRLDSGGVLFLFISSNLLVNIGLVALSAILVRLSFMKKKFTRRTSFAATAAGAVLFGLFGAGAIIFPSLDYRLYDVLKPMDYLIFIEAAIILGVCALTYQHQPLNLKVPAIRRLPQIAGAKKRLAGWLPKPVPAHSGASRTRPA